MNWKPTVRAAGILLLGVLIGIVGTVYLFDVDADWSSVPIKHRGIVLERPLVIRGVGQQVSLPAGTRLVSDYVMPEGVWALSLRFTLGPELTESFRTNDSIVIGEAFAP